MRFGSSWRFWWVWATYVVLDNAAIQWLLFHFGFWAYGVPKALIETGSAVVLSILALVMAMPPRRRLPPGETGDSSRSILRGEYAGTRDEFTWRARSAKRDPNLRVRIAPPQEDIDMAAWGQNLNPNTTIRVETEPGAVVWVHVHYNKSDRPAMAHALTYAIRADAQGRAVWHYRPQQYDDLVDTTTITATALSRKTVNEATLTVAYHHAQEEV